MFFVELSSMRFLLNSPVKLSTVVESNSFEFLRSGLHDGQTLSFQIAPWSYTPTSWPRTLKSAGFRSASWCRRGW